jgi:hypothetical protein
MVATSYWDRDPAGRKNDGLRSVPVPVAIAVQRTIAASALSNSASVSRYGR